VSAESLKCGSCGAVWISLPAREVADKTETCLRCGSALKAKESPDMEREGSAEEREGSAEEREAPGSEPI
jgi:hypothetical protein